MSGGELSARLEPGERDRRLATLGRLLALEATDLSGALQGASDLLAEVMGIAKIDLFIHEPERDILVALGASDTPAGQAQRALGLDYLPLASGGRVVEVFRSGRSYLAADARGDPGVLAGLAEGLGIRALLAVPLIVDGVRRGVLQAAAAEAGRFDEADRDFLTAVARWVGLVAHRAELVERLGREAAAASRRRAAEDLIAVVAHDLRNHIAPLKGQVELIRRRAGQDGRVRDIGSAAAAAHSLARIERLVADLLDAGRLEHGLFTVARRDVDLTTLVWGAATELARGTTPITVVAPPALRANIDPDRLQQALENVLVNAIRYAPPGTAVELTLATAAREDGRWAVLTVADRGPGIPPERRAALFAAYAAGPDSTGLGLGLYLASRVAAAHGGTLTLDPAPGTGARFHLALPLGWAADGDGQA